MKILNQRNEILRHNIFCSIFSKLIQSIDDICKVDITDSTYMYLIRDNKKTMFHFDIMNNPKEPHTFGKLIKKYL